MGRWAAATLPHSLYANETQQVKQSSVHSKSEVLTLLPSKIRLKIKVFYETKTN